MSVMDIGDGELWYEEFGSGDEIVLSSAMGFAAGAYPEILAGQPTSYHVYTIQARGFGRSTHPSRPPESWLDQWADDVCAFADCLGVERFIYTGISHGGGIGWHIACRNPERLKALVSVVGTPHDREGGTASSAGRRRFIEQRHDPEVVTGILEHMAGWSDDPALLESRRRRFAIAAEEAARRPDDEAEINQGKPFPDATTDEALAEVYRGINVPVLILAAMRDGVISPQSALRAAVNVRGAKAVLFEDGGHMIGEESPERLAREVRVFVDELNGVAEPPMRS
ncbi:alpha/beta hydrolase [Microbacterium sp. STN6]|uniref:alpha/beta fold hydrolase n=1 Tax=Microbacterium sp. STN6 TaxID=2995588 RepID=UPI002260AC5C|nr:alpha/beta hydrolase [Microbacterium sp. STN6]MCX7520701.1 alpha/beta hydrolase [Microbacterium sp. STN6]